MRDCDDCRQKLAKSNFSQIQFLRLASDDQVATFDCHDIEKMPTLKMIIFRYINLHNVFSGNDTRSQQKNVLLDVHISSRRFGHYRVTMWSVFVSFGANIVFAAYV